MAIRGERESGARADLGANLEAVEIIQPRDSGGPHHCVIVNVVTGD